MWKAFSTVDGLSLTSTLTGLNHKGTRECEVELLCNVAKTRLELLFLVRLLYLFKYNSPFPFQGVYARDHAEER